MILWVQSDQWKEERGSERALDTTVSTAAGLDLATESNQTVHRTSEPETWPVSQGQGCVPHLILRN